MRWKWSRLRTGKISCASKKKNSCARWGSRQPKRRKLLSNSNNSSQLLPHLLLPSWINSSNKLVTIKRHCHRRNKIQITKSLCIVGMLIIVRSEFKRVLRSRLSILHVRSKVWSRLCRKSEWKLQTPTRCSPIKWVTRASSQWWHLGSHLNWVTSKSCGGSVTRKTPTNDLKCTLGRSKEARWART